MPPDCYQHDMVIMSVKIGLSIITWLSLLPKCVWVCVKIGGPWSFVVSRSVACVQFGNSSRASFPRLRAEPGLNDWNPFFFLQRLPGAFGLVFCRVGTLFGVKKCWGSPILRHEPFVGIAQKSKKNPSSGRDGRGQFQTEGQRRLPSHQQAF